MKKQLQTCIEHFLLQQHAIVNDPQKGKKNLRFFCQYITEQIVALEKRCNRKEILGILEPLRKELGKSPLLKRVQTWPRGYQGDFETIEAIIQYKKFAPQHTLAYLFENYFIHSPIAQQHRNKVHKQYESIVKCVQQKKSAKILSIGCGTSEDIYRAQNEIKKAHTQITLLDIDEDALDYSLCKLEAIQCQINTLQGNIYKLLHTITEEYDLILIGGVFDYVSDKFMINILKKLFEKNISDDGEILFTNIGKNHSFKIALEYFFDWFLMERSEKDIINILASCGINKNAITIEKEETKLTYIVHIHKNVVSREEKAKEQQLYYAL